MGQWLIYGPDRERLSKADVCDFLNVADRTLEKMIADGRFPRGIKPTPQAEPFWHATDIAAWLHLSRLMGAISGFSDQPANRGSGGSGKKKDPLEQDAEENS